MFEIENEQLSYLNRWRESALEKNNESEREYYKRILYGWRVGIYPKVDILLNELKVAFINKNYDLVQHIFFTFNKKEFFCYLKCGYDHCFLVYRVIPYLCCSEFNELYRAFPENLPLSTNGYSMLVNATALLQCILYKDKYDHQKVVEKAQKYIDSKQPIWNRAFVASFLAILKNDDVMLSKNLQTLCDYHSRQSISDFMKFQCQYAYGLVLLAKHSLPESVFQKVKLPEHKTFDLGYMEWLYTGHFVRQSIYNYPSPYEELNFVYQMPLPITNLHQPYLNNDHTPISPQKKKSYHIDTDAMNEQIVDYILMKKKNKT